MGREAGSWGRWLFGRGGRAPVVREGGYAEAQNYEATRINKPFYRGGVGVEVLEVFWEELWLHFFWPTFWLHCILYFTYKGGFAPRRGTVQNAM